MQTHRSHPLPTVLRCSEKFSFGAKNFRLPVRCIVSCLAFTTGSCRKKDARSACKFLVVSRMETKIKEKNEIDDKCEFVGINFLSCFICFLAFPEIIFFAFWANLE